MKLARVIGPLALAFVVISAIVAGRQLVQMNPSTARKIGYPLPVRVVAAEQLTLTESIGANGEVQPIAFVELTARVSAPVQKVTVDLGDIVAPGQVLVQFDPEVLKVALATARASLAQAAAAADRARQQSRRIKANYERGLSSATLATVQSALEQANGDVARAELYHRRIQAIHAQGLLPKIEVEKAQSAVEEAKARQRQAEERLLRAKKDLHLELEKAQGAVEETSLRRKQAEEELFRAKKELQAATVVSPVAGIIMDRQINAGETPRLYQPLFTIGQIDQVLVAAQVSEDRIGDIHVKQAATVTLHAFPHDEFSGEIVKVKPVTDPKTRTLVVYAKVANPDLKLKPGLSSFVRIKREYQGLAVPSIALISPTGLRESAVFVVENGAVARLRRVRVGATADGMTQIVDGLAPGEMVVTVGQLHLRDADQVRIGDEFEDLKSTFAGAPRLPSDSPSKSH
jgi:RND family efflux transporter MFP subunit